MCYPKFSSADMSLSDMCRFFTAGVISLIILQLISAEDNGIVGKIIKDQPLRQWIELCANSF